MKDRFFLETQAGFAQLVLTISSVVVLLLVPLLVVACTGLSGAQLAPTRSVTDTETATADSQSKSQASASQTPAAAAAKITSHPAQTALATYTALPSPSAAATTTPTFMASATPAPTITPSLAPTIIRVETIVVTLTEGITMTFVRVPAGAFLMGSTDADPGARADEKPQHKVNLDGFMIGQFEVTVAQFRAFVQATGYSADNAALPAAKDNFPVTFVSWDDAVAFCQWASQVSGLTLRLPTEAEWEKAARGANGRIYPWGNEAPDNSRANFDNSVGGTTGVGSYPAGASSYGAQDMAGNVWEWVADWYQGDYYVASPGSNPSGPTSGDFRVLRGGGWLSSAGYLRAAERYSGYYPNSRLDYIGFRCVVSPTS